MLVEEFDERSATGVISAVRRDGDAVDHDVERARPRGPRVVPVPLRARRRRCTAYRRRRAPGASRRGGASSSRTGGSATPRCSRTSRSLDPTIVEWAGRWWMFGTRRDRDPNAELWLWHAPSPLGPWTVHAANPVKIDVRSSRPAGTPFVLDGVLYRPAQDCSRGYGGAVVVNRVVAPRRDGVRRGARRAPSWSAAAATRPARTPSPSATASSPSTPAGGSSTSTGAGASCWPGCAGQRPDRARPLRHRQPDRRRRRDVARPHGPGLPRPRPRAARRLPEVALGRRRRPDGRGRHAPPGGARPGPARQLAGLVRLIRRVRPRRRAHDAVGGRRARPDSRGADATSRRHDVRQQQLLTGPARQPDGESRTSCAPPRSSTRRPPAWRSDSRRCPSRWRRTWPGACASAATASSSSPRPAARRPRRAVTRATARRSGGDSASPTTSRSS